MRLAVFVDQVFWNDGRVYSTDESYVLFYRSFLAHCDEIVFVSRLADEPGRKPYALDDPALRLSPIPFYDGIAGMWRAGPQLFRHVRALARREAPTWDALLVCGPNPVGQYLAEQCVALGVPVALVVRQNLVPQVAFTNKGLRRHLAVTYARWLEGRFRRLAAGRPVFAVGQEMTAAYARHTPYAQNHFACLISDDQMAQFGALPRQPEPGRLLCVGRLSAEKGHSHLLEALAALTARGSTCRLDIVGDGPLEQALQAQAAALGLEQLVTFHGYVPYGPELFNLYRRAQALLVPSLQEGFPQVINEAMCVGLPIIASRVGGIPGFLTHGETALLTQPGDSNSLVTAIERILNDARLREELSRRGRELMAANTLEANRDRILQVLHEQINPQRVSPRAVSA